MVLVVKNQPADARDLGSIPGSGRSLGGENGNPLQYSCLGNPKDRGAWWATVHGVEESDKSNLYQITYDIFHRTRRKIFLNLYVNTKDPK